MLLRGLNLVFLTRLEACLHAPGYTLHYIAWWSGVMIKFKSFWRLPKLKDYSCILHPSQFLGKINKNLWNRTIGNLKSEKTVFFTFFYLYIFSRSTAWEFYNLPMCEEAESENWTIPNNYLLQIIHLLKNS